jgi:hypothetical protein
MPQIIVTATRARDSEQGAVMFRERVSPADFESRHFQSQLVERIGWAVGDATEVERDDTAPDPEQEPENIETSTPDVRAPQPAWAR